MRWTLYVRESAVEMLLVTGYIEGMSSEASTTSRRSADT